MTRVREVIALETSLDRVPLALKWNGHRFRVTDTPTRLQRTELIHEAITHPLPQPTGGDSRRRPSRAKP